MILDESINAKDAWLEQVKHHRRRLKGLPRVGFNPDAGNVEHNISMMNKMLDSGEMLSNNPISGPFGGDVSAPAGGTSIGESFDNNNNSRGFDMIDELKRYVLELVQAEYETGHRLSDDYNSFKRLVADDGHRATKSMYEFYLECRELGPAGFLAQYKDELDFDSMFILEYGDKEEVEDKEENIEESLTEKTNMEKLRVLYPELAESYDKDGNAERCEECNALLNDAGECPRCVHGEEDLDEGVLLEKSTEDTIKRINDRADKAAKKVNNKARVNAAKVIQQDISNKDAKNWRFYILDKNGDIAKEFTQTEFINKYKNDAAVRYNALVVDNQGNIVRRGAEWLLPKRVKFYPTDRRANIPQEGYTWQGLNGMKSDFNRQSPNNKPSAISAMDRKPKPVTRTDTAAAETPKEETKPTEAETSKGITDKTIQNTVNAAKVFGMKVFAMQAGEVTELNDAQLKLLGARSPMDKIWVGTDDKTRVTLAQLAAELKKKDIVESLAEGKLWDKVKDKVKQITHRPDWQTKTFGGKWSESDPAYKSAKSFASSYPQTAEVKWLGTNNGGWGVKYDATEEKSYDDIFNLPRGGSNKPEDNRYKMRVENLEEKVITHDSLHDGDMEELLDLAKEIGIHTMGELEEFAEREVPQGTSLIDTLRQYRDDLGDDFEVNEGFDGSPETEIDSYDEVDDVSWFNG